MTATSINQLITSGQWPFRLGGTSIYLTDLDSETHHDGHGEHSFSVFIKLGHNNLNKPLAGTGSFDRTVTITVRPFK